MSVTNLIRSVREYLAAEYEFEAARTHHGDGDVEVQRAKGAVEAARAALAKVADAAAKGEPETGAVAGAGIRRILVAVDETPSSGWATDFAARLASELSAELLLLHVVNPAVGLSPEFVTPDWLSDMHRDAAEMLRRVKSSLPAGVRRADACVREGGPEREIVACAREWEADLIVLGTHGRGHLAQFLLGSTAEGVVRHAPCPVVTVAHAPATTRPNGNGKQKPAARAKGGLPEVMPVPPSRLAQDVIEGMP